MLSDIEGGSEHTVLYNTDRLQMLTTTRFYSQEKGVRRLGDDRGAQTRDH